jgi:hypothetical protein
MSRKEGVENGVNPTATTSMMTVLIIMIIVVTSTVGYSAVFAPEASGGSTSSAVVRCSPTQITSVSTLIASSTQTIVISGCGFGSDPETVNNTYANDGSIDTVESQVTPSIAIVDGYTPNGWTWEAGFAVNPSTPDTIGINIQSWNSTRIVIDGFCSLLGTGSQQEFNINAGDTITFFVIGPDCTAATYSFPPFPSTCTGTFQATVQG